jgi:hypothetical protein
MFLNKLFTVYRYIFGKKVEIQHFNNRVILFADEKKEILRAAIFRRHHLK